MGDRLLVGRDHELGVLEQALAAVARGERAVLMVTGEPGIGKTRLLEELVTRTVAAGGVASWGRTWEVGQTPPFFPWLGVLAALEIPGDPAPGLDSLGQHGDRSARVARFTEVVSFLARRSAHAPIALLFDDLHASDASSLELLDFALPLLTGKKVLFALTARDTDATGEVALALGRLQRGAYRLPLARLDEVEVRQLVGARADGRRVYELSDGNPLFVEELLAAQRAPGELGLPLVSSVRSLLRERVARLPEATRGVLLAAALVGRDFRGRVVAEALGEASVVAVLEPACAIGLVSALGTGSYRFSHALVAEALADELGATARAELHLAIARALERRAPDDTGAIAHHLLAAGESASSAAIAAAERAAENCLSQLAFEDAASFYERALGCLALSSPEDRKKRATLLCARAEALQHATRHALAATLCSEAAAIVRALPETLGGERDELFARIALVRGLELRFGHTDPLLIALLCEAIERLADGSPALRAKLLARLAAAEQPSPDPLATAARALQAIELARDLPARDRLEVSYVASAALVEYIEPDVLEPILEEALQLARGVDRWISVHTRLRHCFLPLFRLDRAQFYARMQAFSAEAEALGLLRWQRYVPMLEALLAVLDGRFEDDSAAVARFEALSEQIDDPAARFLTDVHRMAVTTIRTTPPDPQVSARLAHYVPGAVPVNAWLERQRGSIDGVRSALDQLGIERRTFPKHADLGAMLAEAVAFVGDRALATEIYAAIAGKAGQIVLTTLVGFVVLDLYDRLLLTLATVTESWGAIDGHAESALHVARKLGSPVWKARVEADYADALERRDASGDRARARQLRASARSAAERFGLQRLLERCSAAAPDPAGAATAVESADPLSAREVACIRHGSLWLVRGCGESVHVKDSRGMQMLARLLAEPSTILHALDLAGASELVDGGDAGAHLDGRAREQYRARLRDLVAEREDAERCGDMGRSERASVEVDTLSAELERAFGLGGRSRRAGAASERARTNVQRRITHALEQIRAASPRLGEHLAASIHTGTYCRYEPGFVRPPAK